MGRFTLIFALCLSTPSWSCSYCRTNSSPTPPAQNTQNQGGGGMVVRGATPLKSTLSESGEFFKSIGDVQDVPVIEDEITVVPSVYQAQ